METLSQHGFSRTSPTPSRMGLAAGSCKDAAAVATTQRGDQYQRTKGMVCVMGRSDVLLGFRQGVIMPGLLVGGVKLGLQRRRDLARHPRPPGPVWTGRGGLHWSLVRPESPSLTQTETILQRLPSIRPVIERAKGVRGSRSERRATEGARRRSCLSSRRPHPAGLGRRPQLSMWCHHSLWRVIEGQGY